MKKWALVLLLTACLPLGAQQRIDNSEKPTGNDFGRILELQKVFQIDDPGDEFFFQYPRIPKMAPDGSIFITDSEQILQFGMSGELLRNYYRKGQGPGEMTYIGDFSFFPEGIILQNINPTKMMWLDFSGELLKEFVIQDKGRLGYQFYYEGSYYFIQSEFPRIKGEPQIVDSKDALVELKDDGTLTKLADLPTKNYVVMGKNGSGGSIPLNNLITALLGDRYLFISHNQEYLIKLFDAENNQITKIIGRDYPRVKQTREDLDKHGGPIIDGKKMLPPPQRYVNDIENLFVVGEKLWVQTSFKDRESRALFDVFDLKGKYIDNFYILLPEALGPHGYNVKPISISDGYLTAIEKNPDESLSVVKYRIVDKGMSLRVSR